MASSLLGPPELRLPMATATNPPMGFTENNSATYLSSGNPCLDFFFHIVPDTPPQQVIARLSSAWDYHPLITLKLVCNLRGVRGTGKSNKEGFYAAALWLHKHHPKTLACNLKAIADFGYFKDMLEILYRLLEGPQARMIKKTEWNNRKESVLDPKPGRKKRKFTEEKEKARSLRLEKTVTKARKAFERYKRDPDYKFLHDRVSDFFAELLRSDMQYYNANELNKISLASKWCPTLDSSYDKATLMCESIARKVFPREEHVEYQNIEEAHYAYRVRDRLRKEVLVLSTRRFNCQRSLHDDNGPEVAELQWKRMVDDVAKQGKLANCMAICDVSGSMSGIPMEVSVALGLLISELSEEPWKGKLITFSEKPRLHRIKGESLISKTEFIERMHWGGSTNFQRVFDRILEVAVKGKLGEDQMIKRLFVFSDMEFDQASQNDWETDYKVIQKKFRRKGFQNVPEIVFWNLRDSLATPVPSDQKGVALVSGFSKNLVKLFLEGGGIVNPENVMQQAISGEEYQKLVVFD
ncbi:hypothetical protein TEA_012634 [Camellia sinensis var. sinensis]|uniref:DUF2828 domain-containing protein n=1 Tax=Camellia sinensis var. sinensis TaxID=542762 RepID=A0A4S4EJH3_CAMSN|nr:hypothetical protein TEA_012634 [Camellia sinensis var. sinensis]